MLVTLADGKLNSVYDTETKSVRSITLSQHAMRFHVVEKIGGRVYAIEHIGTTDDSLIDEIMSVMYQRYGRIDTSNEWIKIKLSRREFWPADDYRRMAQDDLSRIFGKRVKVTGTSVRYIYYISDDRDPAHSPDNIGSKFGYPLIYQGYAAATIFVINGRDALSPGNNVVYWLNRSMWNGFHKKKRRVPKEFPGTTGFVGTKWCQRTGYATYGKAGTGIDIAAMTQSKSIATWALNDLRQYWADRQGDDILSGIGESFQVEAKVNKDKGGLDTKTIMGYMLQAQEKTQFGLVGVMCPSCGKFLSYGPYHACVHCGAKIHFSSAEYKEKSYCAHCGLGDNKCKVAPVSISGIEHRDQYNDLKKIWTKVLTESHSLPF